MRIIGRRDLQDYFDHIGYRYGQDERIVYDRRPFPSTTVEGIVHPHIGSHFRSDLVDASHIDFSMRPHISYIVAAKWCFPVLTFPMEEGGKRDELVRSHHAPLLKKGGYPRETQWPSKPPEEFLLALVKAVGAPVFRILSTTADYVRVPRVGSITIDKHVPHLGRAGIAAIVPAEQMWQEIYAVCSNVLRPDPDKMPPTEISNSDKIHTAGFDLKTSFRHPFK